MKKFSRFLFVVFLALLSGTNLNAQDPCGQHYCVGNAVTQTVNTGRGAQYVDVERTPSQAQIRNALTVEMWLKIERQAGMLQYIAGLWGPHSDPTADQNDVWALYITPNNELVFEINGGVAGQGTADNTVARWAAASLYGTWTHVAAVFDGSNETAIIYINGVQVASARNAQTPVSRLVIPNSPELPLKFGSTNARSDAQNNRTLLGQYDEVRLWSIALTAQELRCNANRGLSGTESGLVLYYRCNEDSTAVELCDATGNGNTGLLRANARCLASNREYRQTVVTDLPGQIVDTLRCETRRSWTFTLTDTSACGSTVWVNVVGEHRNFYTLNPQNRVDLQPNQPVQFTLTINTNVVGSLNNAWLRIDRDNERGNQHCGLRIQPRLRITRQTELDFSEQAVIYDTLYAGCRERPFIDTTITIRNNSDIVGTNRAIRIASISGRNPGQFRITPSRGLPATLAIGESMQVRVRFIGNNPTGMYYDTIRVNSDDCSPEALILLEGVVQEVLGITGPGGNGRIDILAFDPECPFGLSDPVAWVWNNLTARPLEIDTILVPDFMRIVPNLRNFPITLMPDLGDRTRFFRFRPPAPGFFSDSIVFVARINGCTIERKVYVSGRGISSEVEFAESDPVSFGNVTVGQTFTRSIQVRNPGTDPIRVSLSLNNGEVFFFAGARTATIPPGQIRTVDVTFRPLEDSCYVDSLRVEVLTCYNSAIIGLVGCGQVETFRFEPIVMRTENVIGCSSRLDTIDIWNETDQAQTLTNIDFVANPGTYRALSPALPLATLSIPPRGFQRFIFEYVPNDVNQDRADRVFLRYTNQGETWEAPLFGTSVAPRLFVTPLTAYGTVEVGTFEDRQIVIENISSIAVRVDVINLPAGFRILNPPGLPRTLQPRDTIRLDVRFEPAAAIAYGGDPAMSVRSEWPCPNIRTDAGIRGVGEIRYLDVRRETLPFGYTPPCECREDVVPVFNTSFIHDMTVDAISIDPGTGPNPAPEYFSWRSIFSPNGTLPYTIPADAVDSVYVAFCPRTPAEDSYREFSAVLHIEGSGTGGWNIAHDVFLYGLRAFPYRPEPINIQFPTTPVDSSLTYMYTDVRIPDALTNPQQLAVTIDSVSFEPNERVFTARPADGRNFPIVLQPGDPPLELELNFIPRAPRCYEARMQLHTSRPCPDIDTTVFVQGCGFADYASRRFHFSTNTTATVTPEFTINYCDTLEIPVIISRFIPAKVVDIDLTLFYDTNLLQFIGASSRFETAHDSCAPYAPAIAAVETPGIGTSFELSNLCGVGTLDTFLLARFLPRTDLSLQLNMRVDSISFDTQDVLLFEIIDAGGAEALINIQKPDFDARDEIIPFDSVRILECVQREVVVTNTGETPVSVDSLISLPPDVRIVGAAPPLGPNDLIAPGETTVITIEFCPQSDAELNERAYVKSLEPCPLQDSTLITGVGYAPDYHVRLGLSPDFSVEAAFEHALADTVTLPVYLEQDLATVYNGITWWLQDIGFDALLNYNPRMLKFLGAQSPIDPAMQAVANSGDLRLEFRGLDTVRAGLIAEITFKVTVPDTVQAGMRLTSANYATDSLMFLNIIPDTTRAQFRTIGICNITHLRFAGDEPQLLNSIPNPVSDRARIDFAMRETVPVTLRVYSANGELALELLDGSQVFEGGTWSVEFDATRLQPGAYYYVLEAGIFRAARKMMVAR